MVAVVWCLPEIAIALLGFSAGRARWRATAVAYAIPIWTNRREWLLLAVRTSAIPLHGRSTVTANLGAMEREMERRHAYGRVSHDDIRRRSQLGGRAAEQRQPIATVASFIWHLETRRRCCSFDTFVDEL